MYIYILLLLVYTQFPDSVELPLHNILSHRIANAFNGILKIINKMDNKSSSDYDMFSNKTLKAIKIKLINH